MTADHGSEPALYTFPRSGIRFLRFSIEIRGIPENDPYTFVQCHFIHSMISEAGTTTFSVNSDHIRSRQVLNHQIAVIKKEKSISVLYPDTSTNASMYYL